MLWKNKDYTSTYCYLMLLLIREGYANTISEKAKGACDPFPAHSNRRMHWRHCIGIGFLARYAGEAMDEPPFSLAFVMVKVKESFVIPTKFFYLESAANKNKWGDDLNRLTYICIQVFFWQQAAVELCRLWYKISNPIPFLAIGTTSMHFLLYVGFYCT